MVNGSANGTTNSNGTNGGGGNGTVNGGGGNGGGGNFTRLHNKRRRPALIALTVNNKKGVKRRRPPKRPNRKNNKFKKGKWQVKKRKPRDLQDESELVNSLNNLLLHKIAGKYSLS